MSATTASNANYVFKNKYLKLMEAAQRRHPTLNRIRKVKGLTNTTINTVEFGNDQGAAWGSSFSTAQTNASFYRFLPAYGVLNAGLDLRNVGGQPFDIGLFVNNLTDVARPIGVLDGYTTAVGVVGLTYTEPRMYGVRLAYRFGN